MSFDLLRELTWQGIVFRIALSVLIGGILGMERGFKNQPAGFRTYMLVCMSSCLVMMTNQYITLMFNTGDPSRLGAQVVSGIGFLGAGTILVTRNNQIRGLTTAAGLWSAACIGLAVGIGFYEGAIIVGIVLMLIMTVFGRLDIYVHSNSKYLRIYLHCVSTKAMNEFLKECVERDIKIMDIQMSKSKGNAKDMVVAIIYMELSKKTNHPDMIADLASIEGVKFIEEI